MIDIKNLTKTLKGRNVLSEINLQFEDGNTYLITGQNGSGKTMLLRAICGLIRPTSGSIEFDRPCSFGVIIENPSFIENETALFNMEYLASIRDIIDRSTIENVLEKVNLLQFKKQKVKRFSLGMKQRLGICQAIMEDPDVLLLDEPFNAIDKENLTQIYNLLNGLREKGKLIIIASHGQVNFSELTIDAEIVMADGRIVK